MKHCVAPEPQRALERTQKRLLRSALQGYSFRVVTDLITPEKVAANHLAMVTHQERLDLLAKLRSSEAGDALEGDANDDGIPGGVKVKRRKRAFADMTGADATYKEYSTKKKTGDSLRKIVNSRRAR